MRRSALSLVFCLGASVMASCAAKRAETQAATAPDLLSMQQVAAVAPADTPIAVGACTLEIEVHAIYLGAGFMTVTVANQSTQRVETLQSWLGSRILRTVRIQSGGQKYRLDFGDVSPFGCASIDFRTETALAPGESCELRIDFPPGYVLKRLDGEQWKEWHKPVRSPALALGVSGQRDGQDPMAEMEASIDELEPPTTRLHLTIKQQPCLIGGVRPESELTR
jgi:hypothetical protein